MKYVRSLASVSVYRNEWAYSATGRLARVMGLLKEAAKRLRVLILTCHPERYATLKGSTALDFEAPMEPGPPHAPRSGDLA